MCFFVCLALPKRFKGWSAIDHSFEMIDVTDWSIGEATSGNRDRDTAFLVTAEGCSCFISAASHRSEKSLDEFESLIRSLLQQTSSVSILMHYASGDISKENVLRKDKRSVIFDDVSGQLDRLEPDVRYIIAAKQAAYGYDASDQRSG